MADHEQNSTDQHALAVQAPARVVGRPYPKGVSGNPAGRPKGHKAVLRELIGEHGVEAYRQIKRIADGELTFEKLAREPTAQEDIASAALIPLVRVVPTVRERLDAWTFLVEQLNGKSTAHVDLHAKVENETRFDFSRVPDALLAQIERGLVVASEGEVVDAEFTTECPGLLPETFEPMPIQAAPVVESQHAQLVRPVTDADASGSDYTWSETP